ncbi:MAG: hypothetical protein ACR2P6_11365 [Gammaproteobacteria bacterium]
MATLAKLQERKEALEEKLYAGDLSVEAELERVDKAIASRKLKIQHSQKRQAAVKTAVQAGMSVKEAKSKRPVSKAAAKKAGPKPVNRFK